MPYKDLKKKREASKIYYSKNKDKVLRRQKIYRDTHHEKELARCRKYANNHKKERALWKRLHRKEINENARRVYKTKIKTNPQYQISKNIHTRLYLAIKNNYIKSDIHNLGCDLKQFKTYIESKFKPKMTWKNYGKRWCIDHIRPLNSFDLTKREELLKCCHFTNTQPLWKMENCIKWTKIV